MSRAPFLKPPFNEAPLVDGEHTQAWKGFHEDVAYDIEVLKANRGVTDGSDAAAGTVGEYLTASVTGSGITSGATVDVVTLALPAGDWFVWGNVITAPAGGTSTTLVQAGISDTSASLTPPDGGSYSASSGNIPAGRATAFGMVRRLNLAASGAAYLVATVAFGGGTMDIYGFLGARRVR